MQWITEALQAGIHGPLALPLAFLLGLMSTVAGACCTLPAISMLAAYSGTRQDANRQAALLAAAFFMIGTVLALVILGWVAGMLGQAAQVFLGRYWRVLAGMAAVILGLAALKFLPFKIPGASFGGDGRRLSGGRISAVVGGLALGGGLAACSLPCNPGIILILGASLITGRIWWSMALMAAFAMGFSLPLAAIVLGVSAGKASINAEKYQEVIRWAAGLLLVIAGFYLLITMQ